MTIPVWLRDELHVESRPVNDDYVAGSNWAVEVALDKLTRRIEGLRKYGEQGTRIYLLHDDVLALLRGDPS